MTMNPEEAILTTLQTSETFNTVELAAELKVPHQAVVGAVKSLEGEGYIATTMKQKSQWKLSDEANKICDQGSPEFRLWSALADGPAEQSALAAALGADVVALGMKNGMKEKVLKVTKGEGKVSVARSADTFSDAAQSQLAAIKGGRHIDPADADGLKKRKLVAQEMIKSFDVVKGAEYAPVRTKLVADLTPQMLRGDAWKDIKFKKLNFNAQGREPAGGQLHPLLKVRQEFREIFLELGFSEMDTQQWAQSSFWNFDSLFVPQKHPARDAQDTFFLSKPATSEKPPADYVALVKAAHEAGYKGQWASEESERNVLRTHTTSDTAWMLYNHAQKSPVCPDTGKRLFKPGRYFSIDRVFRNEEMDKTHLCEFFQVEGCIIGRDISLANMMHTLEQFFRRIGVTQLRFKPAYNPYTEPSMEIFGFHVGLKKWIEVGNSGMFRPELLKPMGYDDGVSAIAWGLSVERPTMIKYGIKNIHELFGHRVDLKFIRMARIARY